jgi:hypothetical protein
MDGDTITAVAATIGNATSRKQRDDTLFAHGTVQGHAHARNTRRRHESAIEVWDEIMTKPDEDGCYALPPFHDLEAKHIGGEQGDYYLVFFHRYCNVIANTSRYNKKSKELKEVDTITHVKGFEAIVSQFRQKFPNHVNLNHPDWSKEMKTNFEKIIN